MTRPPHFMAAWKKVLEIIQRKHPTFRPRLLHCSIADGDHARESRAYCHVNHFPNMVCYAQATLYLEDENLYGLFLHEVGHMLTGAAEEDVADMYILEEFGVSIDYDDMDVETASLKDFS